jgi:hypothetical protein
VGRIVVSHSDVVIVITKMAAARVGLEYVR